MKDIIFEIPNGYELNEEFSDNNRIVLNYNEWITYDKLLAKYLKAYPNFENKRKIKDSAFSKLRIIVNYYNDCCDLNYDGYTLPKYYIAYSVKYNKYIVKECHICISTPLLFKNKCDAEFVIRNPNFKPILDDYFNIK